MPERFGKSPFVLRERSFLRAERTPRAVKELVLLVGVAAGGGAATRSGSSGSNGSGSSRSSGSSGRSGSRSRSSSGSKRSSSIGSSSGSSSDGSSSKVARIELPPAPSSAEVLAALAPFATTPRIHLEDASQALGRLSDEPDGTPSRWLVPFHRDAQQLLGDWCCTSDERFRRSAGLVPYLLPPLEGQTAWRGEPQLSWAETALRQAAIFTSD